MDLRLTGSAGIAGDLDYVVGIKIKGSKSAKWQRLMVLVDKDGFLPLRLKGSITSPSLQPPDPRALLKNQLEGQLQKRLGELFKKKKKKV